MNRTLRFLAERPLLQRRAAAWVRRKRALHRPRAEPLAAAARLPLGDYFEAATLDLVRVRTVSLFDNPPIYTVFDRVGRRYPVDFREMWGVTFMDTILIAAERVRPAARLSLLFHECVHVVQYRLLGLEGFVAAYARGWVASGGQYREIPLERDAYELQRHFRTAPRVPFPVEAEVAARLGRL